MPLRQAVTRTPGRWGGIARPSGSSSPVSSKTTTELHRRFQPCSGWRETIRASSWSGESAGRQGGECGQLGLCMDRPLRSSWCSGCDLHLSPGPCMRMPGCTQCQGTCAQRRRVVPTRPPADRCPPWNSSPSKRRSDAGPPPPGARALWAGSTRTGSNVRSKQCHAGVMAGGIGRRAGPTLADRLAASAVSGGPAPADGAERSRERPVVARHCWVVGLTGSPGRQPGLLAEWRHDEGSGRWLGRVVYAVDEHGRVVLIERWVPAEHLTPA
jgi:hypothetical protein